MQGVARTVRSDGHGHTRLLLSGAAGCFTGYVALASSEALLGLDDRTRGLVGAVRNDLLTAPVQVLTSLGDAVGLVPLIGLTMLLLWRSCRRWALALPLVMAGAGALQWLAKWLADRPRPDATAMGFPSGHVLTLVVLFGLIAYLAAGSGRRAWTLAGWAVCPLMVMSVGFTRLYLDRHWLSDLGGGLMIGLAYLLVVIWLVDVVCPRGFAADRQAGDA